jgi:indole-3-glycerol phosphate synthase
MNILEKIIIDKKRDIQLKKSIFSVKDLEKLPLFNRQTQSLKLNLKNSLTGIIAEHKRRSPSKIKINYSHHIEDVIKGYTQAGVCGISVLTDAKYFGGSTDDLIFARACTNLPLLRKDFVVDTYQILEAKAFGADIILLIAAVLSKNEIRELSTFAKSLGLEVLLEAHDEAELNKAIMPSLDMIGVNNRNLKTFEVSLENSKKLANLIPDDFIKISESGISHVEAIQSLQKYGFQGFLMGEHFMRSKNIYEETQTFINQI